MSSTENAATPNLNVSMNYDELKLLDTVIDEFIIPLANMHLDATNTVNIVELCRKAAEWMELPY